MPMIKNKEIEGVECINETEKAWELQTFDQGPDWFPKSIVDYDEQACVLVCPINFLRKKEWVE